MEYKYICIHLYSHLYGQCPAQTLCCFVESRQPLSVLKTEMHHSFPTIFYPFGKHRISSFLILKGGVLSEARAKLSLLAWQVKEHLGFCWKMLVPLLLYMITLQCFLYHLSDYHRTLQN